MLFLEPFSSARCRSIPGTGVFASISKPFVPETGGEIPKNVDVMERFFLFFL